ncbi:MAG: FixH family protein [Alphaproteobacteria bacterium]|nr:FixH family protein [Alphaproteobacteria bacterium]
MTTQRRSLIPFVFPLAMLPVFAANGTLIYLALHSKPALVSEHPYEDGRAYNHELEAADAQAALGWTATLNAPLRPGTPGPIALDMSDKTGAPVQGLQVALRIWRPVGRLGDIRVLLTETAPGRYTGLVTLPAAGQWQFDFMARRGEREFAYARRLSVP